MIAIQTDITRIVKETLRERGVDSTDQEFILNLFDSALAIFEEGSILTPERIGEIAEDISINLLDHHHLLTLLRQKTAELDALKNLSLHLSSSLDLNTILKAVVSDAVELHQDTRTAHIFLYDESEDKIYFGAALDETGLKEKSYSPPRQSGLTYQVARKGQRIVVPDMRNHPIYENTPKGWTGSIVGIPLKIEGNVVGVMNISRTNTGEFSEASLRLLELLADQAAIAISNARLHAQVSQQAKSDTMTGLPNRRALDERLDVEINAAHRTGYSFVTVMMDLDGFKEVNDSYGHPVGDQVLRTVFNYLNTGVRTSDFLARYGGDELTLVLTQSDLSAAVLVTEKLTEKLKNFAYSLPDGKKLNLGMSGGIALYPVHGRTPTELLRAADQALYRAKKYNRGGFEIATPPTGQLG
ncbi:MAG: diguanylate cyclase [Anaerolineae bacterium]|jgi:diguanylate cyclase (GGDEF)-like protein|nr:diguanylate cyclase [Anaerolineae bacterium]MBT7071775.1 diguanylate cyclase [Anaerolineae bacterium]MBT7991100.1 diguanylate cyclase [Anaerolineae bacterium]